MLEAIRAKLIAEVEALNHELHVTLPEVLQKARELGDLKENGDYQAAKERQGFVALRLGQLRSRLSKLSQIDLSQIPVDRIGLGSRVTLAARGRGGVSAAGLARGRSRASGRRGSGASHRGGA